MAHTDFCLDHPPSHVVPFSPPSVSAMKADVCFWAHISSFFAASHHGRLARVCLLLDLTSAFILGALIYCWIISFPIVPYA